MLLSGVLMLTTTRRSLVHGGLYGVSGGVRCLLQGLGAEMRMKNARPGRGVIGVDPKNTLPDLTKRTPVYLIRASNPYAQVAQSVEQRTENTKNSLGKPKNRNRFLCSHIPSPELSPNLSLADRPKSILI